MIIFKLCLIDSLFTMFVDLMYYVGGSGGTGDNIPDIDGENVRPIAVLLTQVMHIFYLFVFVYHGNIVLS